MILFLFIAVSLIKFTIGLECDITGKCISVSEIKVTLRKARKTEFIYICGSKNGSINSTVNTGEV